MTAQQLVILIGTGKFFFLIALNEPQLLNMKLILLEHNALRQKIQAYFVMMITSALAIFVIPQRAEQEDVDENFDMILK